MSELYDAPNQQVVRADGSGPGDEGEGGSEGEQAAQQPTATVAASFPRSHADLDSMLDDYDVEEPEDWGDLKVDEKIAYLKAQGVEPD